MSSDGKNGKNRLARTGVRTIRITPRDCIFERGARPIGVTATTQL